MKVQFILPRKELKPYISKIWIFENNSGLVNHGTLIAPNGKAKIIIPYRNILTTTDASKTGICTEGNIHFIGIRDVPVTLSSPARPTGSVGIEFNSDGACRFIKIPMYQFTNGLFTFADIFGTEGNDLKEQIINEENPQIKINIMQEFLFRRLLSHTSHNSLVSYTVNLITSSNGLTSIKELERKTGYSKRYLDMLFKNHLGISPKTLASMNRFQHFYNNFRQREMHLTLETDIYNMYYDQNHFIKEFKRYTGLTPTRFSKINNDFGRHF
jgi:AraC-like DNA-binding protein